MGVYATFRLVLARKTGKSELGERAAEDLLKLEPNNAAAHAEYAGILTDDKRYSAALNHFDLAMRGGSTLRFLRGDRLFAKLSLCLWDDYDSEVEAIAQGLRQGDCVAQPMLGLALGLPPGLQLRRIFPLGFLAQPHHYRV